MSWYSLGTDHIKSARKDHRCFGCCDIIPKGTSYEVSKGLWEGEFSTCKLCPSCSDHITESGEYDDGFTEGQLGDGRRYSATAKFPKELRELWHQGYFDEVDDAPILEKLAKCFDAIREDYEITVILKDKTV